MRFLLRPPPCLWSLSHSRNLSVQYYCLLLLVDSHSKRGHHKCVLPFSNFIRALHFERQEASHGRPTNVTPWPHCWRAMCMCLASTSRCKQVLSGWLLAPSTSVAPESGVRTDGRTVGRIKSSLARNGKGKVHRVGRARRGWPPLAAAPVGANRAERTAARHVSFLPEVARCYGRQGRGHKTSSVFQNAIVGPKAPH